MDAEKISEGKLSDISESLVLEQSLTPGVYYPKKHHTRCHQRKKISRIGSKRVIFKSGEFNVDKPNPDHKFKFLSNWFLSMVEARWRWTLFNFFLAFVGDWLFFGFLYWIIALLHGDLMLPNLPMHQNETKWTPCVENILGFTSSFLFSVEVHTTVAYGHRSVTLECPQAIFAMCMQCILSSVFQAFMVGILFAKLTRPKARTQTIMFSKNAVITMRDEKLCLIYRVGDIRKSKILNIKASMYLIQFDKNDDVENYNQEELAVDIEGCESMFFLWPVSVVHVINEASPLFRVSAADLLSGRFEILVVFEGIIESTGQSVQARSSFTENEILWGYRYLPIVTFDYDKSMFDVDFSKLNETVQFDTPLCSACELESCIDIIMAHDSRSVSSASFGSVQSRNKDD